MVAASKPKQRSGNLHPRGPGHRRTHPSTNVAGKTRRGGRHSGGGNGTSNGGLGGRVPYRKQAVGPMPKGPPWDCPLCNQKFKFRSWMSDHAHGKRGRCGPREARELARFQKHGGIGSSPSREMLERPVDFAADGDGSADYGTQSGAASKQGTDAAARMRNDAARNNTSVLVGSNSGRLARPINAGSSNVTSNSATTNAARFRPRKRSSGDGDGGGASKQDGSGTGGRQRRRGGGTNASWGGLGDSVLNEGSKFVRTFKIPMPDGPPWNCLVCGTNFKFQSWMRDHCSGRRGKCNSKYAGDTGTLPFEPPAVAVITIPVKDSSGSNCNAGPRKREDTTAAESERTNASASASASANANANVSANEKISNELASKPHASLPSVADSMPAPTAATANQPTDQTMGVPSDPDVSAIAAASIRRANDENGTDTDTDNDIDDDSSLNNAEGGGAIYGSDMPMQRSGSGFYADRKRQRQEENFATLPKEVVVLRLRLQKAGINVRGRYSKDLNWLKKQLVAVGMSTEV